MPLFEIDKESLTKVIEDRFKYERDLQRLIEHNLTEIFQLDFIATEFQVQSLRIDTLAFNPATKSFVIIEYKRDRSFSIVDQGFAYLSTLLNHKADFVLAYNKRKRSNCDKDDFDWSSTRVYFLANDFSSHQRAAISLRGIAINLWRVVRYRKNLISIDQVRSAETTASITSISKDPVIQSVAREVRQYEVNDLFKKNWENTRALYEELKSRVLEIDSDLTESPTASYIGFKIDSSNVGGVHVQKSGLILFLSRTKPTDLIDPKHKARYRKNCFKFYHQHITDVTVKSSADVEYAVSLFRQVYERFMKRGK